MVSLLVLLVLAVHYIILRNVLQFDVYVAVYDGLVSSLLLCTAIWGIVLLIRA